MRIRPTAECQASQTSHPLAASDHDETSCTALAELKQSPTASQHRDGDRSYGKPRNLRKRLMRPSGTLFQADTMPTPLPQPASNWRTTKSTRADNPVRMGMDQERVETMSTPIGNNLQNIFDDVRKTSFKRGQIQAQLDLIKALERLDLEQRTAAWLAAELMKHLEGIETPKPAKVETRGRKKKVISE